MPYFRGGFIVLEGISAESPPMPTKIDWKCTNFSGKASFISADTGKLGHISVAYRLPHWQQLSCRQEATAIHYDVICKLNHCLSQSWPLLYRGTLRFNPSRLCTLNTV